MGLFGFIDELFDMTEEVIRDTPKTIIERNPGLTSGEALVDVAVGALNGRKRIHHKHHGKRG